jgi:hypothetical protein
MVVRRTHKKIKKGTNTARTLILDAYSHNTAGNVTSLVANHATELKNLTFGPIRK